MAKKKAVKKKTTAKKTATKKAAKKKPAKKSTARKKVVKKKTPKKASKKTAKKSSTSKPAKKTKPKSKSASLGRPRVTGDARLDQFFKKDYEARQVFDFLKVQTVRELESHPPEEIVELLTAPMVQTVNRIRKALAMNNRCLSGDKKFAKEFQQQLKG